MKDFRKTKAQLLTELEEAHRRIHALTSDLQRIAGRDRSCGAAADAVEPWPSGAAPGLLEGLRDISERQGAEGVLRAFIEFLPVDFWAMNADGRYVFQNAANRRYWGDLVGSTIEDVPLSPELRAAWAAQDHRAMAGETVDEEYVFTRNGRTFVFHKTIAPVWRDGEVMGIVCVAFDVTARAQLEQDLLNVSDRELQRIGQDLHDNLGQQLAGILYLVRGLDNELRATESPMAAHAGEIADLVKGALDITQNLARGLRPLGVGSGGLIPALEELAAVTRKLFKISCTFTRDPAIKITDEAVSDHLYRIAQEAASNAVKHGKAQTVQIALTRSSGANLLQIDDDGNGLPADCDLRGGMGLRIMRQRAKMIGGRLVVESSGNGGTLVRCHFR